jgi:periplasmic divalent cation tolerance protein
VSGAARLVLTTVADRAGAERLARSLVGERLAACVNLLPGVRSIYRWQGAVEESDEILLVIKTTAGAESAVSARVRELHPYDVPELITLDPTRVDPAYLAWLSDSIGNPGA